MSWDTLAKAGERETFHMNALYQFTNSQLGLTLEPRDLSFLQLSLRGIIVLVATLIMIRLGHKRSLARKTAFDAVLIVIVLLHRLLAFFAYHSHWFGCLLKGHNEIIVENGEIVTAAMRGNHISIHDLEENLRLHAD